MRSQQQQESNVRYGRISASLISIACFLRHLPLFFGKTPKTPLRVLCLIAFDTLHVLRSSKPLPRRQIKVLAVFLDFAACVNAALDHKSFRREEYRAFRQRLSTAGFTALVPRYLRRLRKVEKRRPSPGGGRERFEQVRAYRESVVRLSLETLAVIALGDECVEEELGATPWGTDLEILARIVMQCQIIDDVLDYGEDAATGLPGFLTAAESLPQALVLTAKAARSYAAYSEEPRSASRFPFRLALFAVSAFTHFVIRACRWQWPIDGRQRPLANKPPRYGLGVGRSCG